MDHKSPIEGNQAGPTSNSVTTWHEPANYLITREHKIIHFFFPHQIPIFRESKHPKKKKKHFPFPFPISMAAAAGTSASSLAVSPYSRPKLFDFRGSKPTNLNFSVSSHSHFRIRLRMNLRVSASASVSAPDLQSRTGPEDLAASILSLVKWVFVYSLSLPFKFYDQFGFIL